MRVHLVTNAYRPDAIAAASVASSWLVGKGVEVRADKDAAPALRLQVEPEETFANCDLVIGFGGDGTLIRAAHLAAIKGTPVLGVYYGRFGFVTQSTARDIEPILDAFLRGEFKTERRMMLDAELWRNDKVVHRLSALNEAVLQRDISTRMMTFRIVVDDVVLTSYPADGVIISTPTGSTAYNLSAGGPIVHPAMEALMLTAIAPHTLNARTLVLPATSEIRLQIRSQGDAVLSADGQSRLHILSGDEVRVTRSKQATHLVSVRDNDFLQKLGKRLLWSQGLVESAT